MALVKIYNGAAPGSSSAFAPVTTGTGTLKTMLQLKASATNPIKVREWGISFSGKVADEPILVELVETSGAATVTALAAADLVKMDGAALLAGDLTTNLIPVGTTSTGFTASGEGTPSTSRLFDCQLVAPTNQYVKQDPLGAEGLLQIGLFLRIRIKPNLVSAVTCVCYYLIEV